MKENLVQKLDLLEAQLARIEGREEDVARLNRTKHLLDRLEKSGNTSDKPTLLSEIQDTRHEIVNRKKYYAESSVKRILKQFLKVEPLRIAKRKKSQAGNAEKLANLDAEVKLVSELDPDVWSRDIVERFMAKKFVTSYEKRSLTSPEINLLARIGKTEAVKKALTQLEESVHDYMERNEAEGKETAPTQAPQKREQPSKKEAARETAPETAQANQEEPEDDFTKFESESESEPEADPFFQEHVGLPEIQEGFISGSEDDEPIEEEKPARRNRRGQRARRKIWEQKFGHRANHVIKQEKQEQQEQQEKEQRKRKRAEKQQAFKRQRIEFDNKPVHPSWVAQQKLKEQQKEAKPQGKKIQFD